MTTKDSKLLNFANKILNFTQNFEKTSTKLPEILVLVLYPILYWVFSSFHEPWFDEAQAWQIAKCASYKEILFYLPHFEGHPPFWHLILSVFAKNNFPYEITLKSVSFVFSYMTVFLIVLKSPFYRLIKILLPFCYFLFYQYGIISRPYCIIGFAFCLCAIFYQKNPLKYAFALILLSLSHVYAFILSSFLTLHWFIFEIKNKSIKSKKIIAIFMFLLLFYILEAACVFPSSEALGMNEEMANNIFVRLTYTFFILPADSFMTFICTGSHSDTTYKIYDIVFGCLGGFLVWYFLYIFTKNKGTFSTFLIPYIPFAIFATKYFYVQHCGIIFCFIMFICWITLNASDSKVQINPNIKKCFTIFVVISLFSSLYWSFKSCLLDVFLTYSLGRKEALFIKKHNLDKYKILVEWANDDHINPNLNGIWVAMAPYFEKNIFYNFNCDYPKRNYVLNKIMQEKEIEETFNKWKKQGYPDVIAGRAELNSIFPKENAIKNYDIVFSNNYTYIYKGAPLGDKIIVIMVKKDLAKKLNLKPVKQEIKNYKLDLFRISTYIFCKIFDLTDKIKGK